MTDLTVSGKIISIYRGANAANIFLMDHDNPKRMIYKVTFWDDEADAAMEALEKDDEIIVSAKIYLIGSNQYGSYIDLRMCKLISITKIQRTIIINPMITNAVEDTSLPQE